MSLTARRDVQKRTRHDILRDFAQIYEQHRQIKGKVKRIRNTAQSLLGEIQDLLSKIDEHE